MRLNDYLAALNFLSLIVGLYLRWILLRLMSVCGHGMGSLGKGHLIRRTLVLKKVNNGIIQVIRLMVIICLLLTWKTAEMVMSM